MHEAVVESPHPSGGDEGEDQERHPLVGLLPHPAAAGEVDELEEELLAESDERSSAGGQADDERGADAELDGGDDPLEEPVVDEDDVVDERWEAGDVRSAVALVDLELEDAPGPFLVDEETAVGPDLDRAELEELGEAVGETG